MKLIPRGGAGALFPLAIMLLLAMLTLWLARTIDLSVQVEPAPANREPDYIVEKFTLTRLSDTGQPRYSLTADRMLHIPADDQSYLTRPNLRQLQPGKPELRITAERGIVTAGGETAYLHDNVELYRAAEAPTAGKGGGTAMRITTTYLRVVPDEDRADTPAPVRVEQGQSVLNGTGMDFDNRYRQFRLHADIRASYLQRRGKTGEN